MWLQVVGVVERRDFTASASDELGTAVPTIKSLFPHAPLIFVFRNRSLIRLRRWKRLPHPAEAIVKNTENLNQLNKIIVQVTDTEHLSSTAEIIRRMLLRRHNNLFDFEVTIPELLLKQQQRTKNIFNIVFWGDCRNFLIGWRNWNYEYHVGFSDGANPRNWRQTGDWCLGLILLFSFSPNQQ